MATRALPLSPLRTDRLLGWITLVMLAILAAAVFRGRAHWGEVPWPVWAHLVTVMPAMALTPVILNRPRGDRTHRVLGYIWVTLLAATALISFDIRVSGQFSLIHLISVFTLVMLVLIVRSARAHDIVGHRRRVRGLVIGALLIAGFFTLPFGRLLGSWLAGG